MALSMTSNARTERSTAELMLDRVATPSFWIVVALILHLAVGLTAGAVAENHQRQPPPKKEAKLSFVKVDLPKEPEPPPKVEEKVEKPPEKEEPAPIVKAPEEKVVEEKVEPKKPEEVKKPEKKKKKVEDKPKPVDPKPAPEQDTFVNFGTLSGSTATQGSVAVTVGDSAAGALPQQPKESTKKDKPKPVVETQGVDDGEEDGGDVVVVSRKKLSRKAQPNESYNRKIKAEYPADLLAAGVEADVILIATVKSNGRVSKLEVVNVVDKRFAEAAKKAVMKFKFEPALEDDEPVASEFRIVYRFRLDDY